MTNNCDGETNGEATFTVSKIWLFVANFLCTTSTHTHTETHVQKVNLFKTLYSTNIYEKYEEQIGNKKIYGHKLWKIKKPQNEIVFIHKKRPW